ncbi:hypothetical protein Taro_002738, partial [Colocasia esculenta]|nr:hypothetical protein [Colocasia esculenta]
MGRERCIACKLCEAISLYKGGPNSIDVREVPSDPDPISILPSMLRRGWEEIWQPQTVNECSLGAFTGTVSEFSHGSSSLESSPPYCVLSGSPLMWYLELPSEKSTDSRLAFLVLHGEWASPTSWNAPSLSSPPYGGFRVTSSLYRASQPLCGTRRIDLSPFEGDMVVVMF